MSENSNGVSKALFISSAETKILPECVLEFVKNHGKCFGLLYSPRSCYLATVDNEGKVTASSGKEEPSNILAENELRAVFEARFFNSTAEMRWLHEAEGKGKAVVLSQKTGTTFFGSQPVQFKTTFMENGKRVEKELVDAFLQTYLFWGESIGTSENKWTRFGEARIGSFFLPIDGITSDTKLRAQFTAIEYFGEYEDGNVAVADERLTGITLYEEKNNG